MKFRTRYRIVSDLPKARYLEKDRRTTGFNARVYQAKSGFAVIWSIGFPQISGAVKA
jgi:hypothetical protein